MTRREIGNLVLYEFQDFEEYLAFAADPNNKQHVSRYAHHSRTPESKFGTWEFEGALHNARFGWKESLEEIHRWSDMVVADISTHVAQPEIVYDKTGSFWDLGRVIENDPECWLDEAPGQDLERSGKGNVVRLVINTASSYAVRSKSHLHRSGAILALSEVLEKAGFLVQIEITTALQVGSTKLEFRTIAKKASEALNLAAVSYWCSSQMEQRTDFSICESLPECVNGGVLDYGTPIFAYGVEDSIVFDRMHLRDVVDWNSEASARKYIVTALRRQGVILT